MRFAVASQSYGAGDRAGVISWAITASIVMSIVGVSLSVSTMTLLSCAPVAKSTSIVSEGVPCSQNFHCLAE